MKKDVKSKEFLQKPENFADAFNYYLFNGEQVIKESDLIDRDAEELIFIGKSKSGEAYRRLRDLLRSCTIKSDGKTTYLLLGIENQSELHYAMPVKNLLYDALDYAGQVKRAADQHNKNADSLTSAEFLTGFTSEDRLTPVITLVIYWGDNEWNAPKSLSEMYSDFDDRLRDYVSDYRINLITPYDIEDFNKFHSELGEVLEIIKRQREENLAESLISEKGLDWTMSRSAVEVINEFTKSKITTTSKREGDVKMCRAFEVLEERGEKKGLEKHLIAQICRKLVKGKPVSVIADELEEPEENVARICAIASNFAPEYDAEKILEKMWG